MAGNKLKGLKLFESFFAVVAIVDRTAKCGAKSISQLGVGIVARGAFGAFQDFQVSK